MAARRAFDTVDGDSPTPKHVQLRQILLKLIDTELGVDQMLPSEREIADRFGVARMTVRHAVDRLVADGRVYKVLGKGAFVARPRLVMPLTLTSFTKDMQDRGLRPGSLEIARGPARADHELAALLHVEVGEALHLLERLRLADGEPLAVERSYLVARRTPGLLEESLADRSLYTVLEQRYGLLMDGGDQTIGAGLADEVDAELLQLPVGREVLRFRRRSMAAGAPLEYAVSTYRGDRYQLQVSFGPSAPAGTPR